MSGNGLGKVQNLKIFTMKLLLVMVALISGWRTGSASRAQRALLEELFETRQYNNLARPIVNEEESIQVSFRLQLRQIVSVDEQQELLHVNVFYEIVWKDADLAWNESDFGGIRRLSLPNDKIWKPDIVLTNSAKSDKPLDESFVMLMSDGTCVWVPFAIETSYCPIDIRWYPFDDQSCVLQYASWSYDQSKLNLTVPSDKISLALYRNSTAWRLVDTVAEQVLVYYPNWDEPYAELKFTMRLRRQSLYYEVNLIMPYTVVALLTVMTYFLPPDTGDRIGLGITIVLSLTVYQLIVAEKIPPTSDGVPLVGIYFLSVMLTSALSLAGSIIVHYLMRRSTTLRLSVPAPECLDKAQSCSCVAPLLPSGARLMKSPDRSRKRDPASRLSDNDMATAGFVETMMSEDEATRWRRSALFIDRLFYWMVAAYLIGSSIGMSIYCLITF